MSSFTGQDQDVKKFQEVMEWLKTIYTDVPRFEVNEFTIDKLYSIMESCKKSARNTSLVMQDLERKKEEYEAETKRLKAINEHVGIVPERLSTKGQSALRNLASAACSLDVRKPSETSLLLALSDITRDGFKVRSERRKEKRMAESLSKTTTETVQKIQQFQKVLPNWRKDRATQQAQCQKLMEDSTFLKSKIKNYNFDIFQLEEKYKQSGMEDQLAPQVLQAKIEHLQKCKDQLSLLHSKLKSYKDLPPNEELAYLKVEEVKKELQEVEKNILQHMS